MSYYDDTEGYKARGMDYDLVACLEYNPQRFGPQDIQQVLAVIEGERDGDNWHWVLQLKPESAVDGKWFAYLTGGCDYTGWDCRSGADSDFWLDPISACHGYSALLDQLGNGRSFTWREQMDAKLGVTTTATNIEVKQGETWQQVAVETDPKRVLWVATTHATQGKQVRLVVTETKVVKIVDEDQLFKNILGD